MSLRQGIASKAEKENKTSKKHELSNVLERLIATLNRIENKLDTL